MMAPGGFPATAIAGRNGEDAGALRRLLDAATAHAVLRLDPLGRLEWWNRGAELILGLNDGSLGQNLGPLLEDGSDAALHSLLQAARHHGRGQYEGWMRGASGTLFWAKATATPLASGGGVAFALIVEDASRSHADEAWRQNRAREMSHRARNTFAIVRAMATQSQRYAEPDVALLRFTGRLEALSRSYALLSARGWNPVLLPELAAAVLRPLLATPSRLILDGPELQIESEKALQLGMALHELGGNAVLHGALSNDTGHVQLSWHRVQDGRAVSMVWREEGGPPVVPPTRFGFGLNMAQASLAPGDPDAVMLDFAPEGFACTLILPLLERLETG